MLIETLNTKTLAAGSCWILLAWQHVSAGFAPSFWLANPGTTCTMSGQSKGQSGHSGTKNKYINEPNESKRFKRTTRQPPQLLVSCHLSGLIAHLCLQVLDTSVLVERIVSTLIYSLLNYENMYFKWKCLALLLFSNVQTSNLATHKYWNSIDSGGDNGYEL
jgi:hypothetical protein